VIAGVAWVGIIELLVEVGDSTVFDGKLSGQILSSGDKGGDGAAVRGGGRCKVGESSCGLVGPGGGIQTLLAGW
jgi:hypothetical protein